MSLGFRFTPFTNNSVTTQWATKDKPVIDQKHTKTQSIPGSENFSVPLSAMFSHAHHAGSLGRRTNRAPVNSYESDLRRQLDSETDANTEFNAAKLQANIRPRSISLDRGRGKSSKSRSKDKEKAKKKVVADQARRTRRRAAGLESDTTQGEDSDSDEYVTGYGKSRPVQGMFGSAGSKRTHKPSTSLPDMPPIHGHQFVSPASAPGQPGSYSYATYTPAGVSHPHGPPGASHPFVSNPYGPSGSAHPYGVQPSPYVSNHYGTQTASSSHFSSSASASGQLPNLFTSTNPGKSSNHASHFGSVPTNESRHAAEAAARQKLKSNPLPGVPGQSRTGSGGMPGFGDVAAGPGVHGIEVGGVHAAGFGGLPGGYGPSQTHSTREKSKSKGSHTKSASTGMLSARAANTYPPTQAYVRQTKTSDPPLAALPNSTRGRGRSGERGRGERNERSRSRSRAMPGWDTADGLLSREMGGPRDGAAILNNHSQGPSIISSGPTTATFNGIPVVNAGPQLERIPSRSKWGNKIAGLFGRGRRGSSASQQEAANATYPPPTATFPPGTSRYASASEPDHPASAPPTKTGFRSFSFDRLRRPSQTQPSVPGFQTSRRSHDTQPPRGADVGLPPGQVPVGVRVDRYGTIVDNTPEKDKGKGRVMGFRLGRNHRNEEVEGPVRIDGRGAGMRASEDRRPSWDGRRPSMEARRPSLDGPDAYGPAPRQRSGSNTSQPPPPLFGTIGTGGIPGRGDAHIPSRADMFGTIRGDPYGSARDPYAASKDPFGLHPDAHKGDGGFPGLKSPIRLGPPPLSSTRSPEPRPSWDGRDLVSPHTPAEPAPMSMPSPHPLSAADPRSPHPPSMLSPQPPPQGLFSPQPPSQGLFSPRAPGSQNILSPRAGDGLATPFTRYEAAGATPFMREREVLNTPRAPSVATTVPRTLPRPRTTDSTVNLDSPASASPSPDVTEADVARAAQHRDAFELAEQDANERLQNGDENARYIFNGFPMWVNWDLFTRLENAERRENNVELLPRVTSLTPPEAVPEIYNEWHATRDKWVDRFWDRNWAEFMHTHGGPIQQELAEERKTPMGKALEAARVYQRENSELPLAKREFARGYMWDHGYMHDDWRWIKEKPWRWTVEHENDERRATGRAPLPRYYAGMSHDDWRDVRDVWHTTASKWAEKRKDLEWLQRDRQEGITHERRQQLEQQYLKSRQQHKVIRKASGQRSREALRPEERDKIRHDSAMELLARRQEAFKQAQVMATPQISEAELTKRRLAQQELDELMRTPAPSHARPASSIGHATARPGEDSMLRGGSSIGHLSQPGDGWGAPMPDESDTYESTSSGDLPPAAPNPYARTPNGFPPPPQPEPLPDWMRRQKTSDPLDSSRGTMPGRNPSVPSVGKKKPGILKGILKRTLSIQRNNNGSRDPLARSNSQKRNGGIAGMFGHGHSQSEVSPLDNPWAGVFRSEHPVSVQPIRFDRSHPFSMTSPHALEYEGKLYPSAIHLWHALRFLRRPARGRGRGRNVEESLHPELADAIRQAAEPELYADQWAHAGAIGKDGTIMRSLQRPDWEEVQMEKMDEVLALKFTQHPSLGKRLMSTYPAVLLYMWDGPWGAGPDLRGPNNLGKAVMRCRERLIQHHGRI